jgi:FixJ family two-component response regulator
MKRKSSAPQIFLAGYGYRITSLSDSTAAYAWFCANPREVDLVITDMSMPHLTGKELAMKMLALRPDLPIILCSGFSEVISEEDVKKIGIRAFFLKPFLDKVVVARLVRQVLDSGRADT